MSALPVLLGIGGGLGVAYFFYAWGSGGKVNILAKVHKIFQKKKVEEIKGIEKKQNVVRTEIATKEKISKQSQEKIKTIQKKAADEIEEVLKKENVGDIHKSITSDWGDI